MKQKINLSVALFIGLSFFWTGSLYLSLMYHLYDLGFEGLSVDFICDVIFYLFQALGCFLFYLTIKRRSHTDLKKLFIFICLLDLGSGLISFLASQTNISLLFGCLCNIFHGLIAGYYLYLLARHVSKTQRAMSFGLGYACGTIASYLLSIIGKDNFINNSRIFIAYLIAAVISIFINNKEYLKIDEENETAGSDPSISLLIIFVILINTIKNGSFYFPFQDISLGISLELSRCFYAIGLLLAGYINDRNRKYGLMCCIVSLIFPFVMMSLQNMISARIIIWTLNYFFLGFFNVYRIIIFADLGLEYASFGLLFGRIGDALGAFLGIALEEKEILFIILMTILYICSIILYFHLNNRLYEKTVINEEILKNSFYSQFALSSREKDVCELILQNKNNHEIAELLFISDNTVKSHIKNILKKTNCKNKVDLINMFNRQF